MYDVHCMNVTFQASTTMMQPHYVHRAPSKANGPEIEVVNRKVRKIDRESQLHSEHLQEIR